MFNFFRKKEVQPIISYEICEKEDYFNIKDISLYFQNETGITFDMQESILKNKLTTFCRLRNICSFDTLLISIKKSITLKQELIDYLTTNETFFYREFKQVEQLVSQVKDANKKVDILCAPCSSGEEPYSIAIALLEAGIGSDNFHIVGIDINSEAIKKAKDAIYKERNIRNLSENLLNKYFTKKGNEYILHDKIKSKISFKTINIFDNDFSSIGKFDYIFSRNMLIYFDKETKLKARKILENLRKDNSQEIFFGHADLF